MNAIPKIDVHHHFFPSVYKKELENTGQNQLIDESWTIEGSLKLMDMRNVQIAYLSVPFAPLYGNPLLEQKTVRECNESAAEIISRYPGRFGAFASIPYMSIDNCLNEIDYALETLNLDGIILHSNTRSEIPYCSDLDILYSELEKREAVVLVHPNTTVKKQLTETPAYNGNIEYYFDTARYIISMLFNGTLEKYRNIRYILVNGGGIVPFLSQRISRTYYLKGERLRWGKIISDMKTGKNSGQELLNSLYYETSTVLEPGFISALKNMVGSKHIIYGSNYGENLKNDLNDSLDRVVKDEILNNSETNDIFSLNAKRILMR